MKPSLFVLKKHGTSLAQEQNFVGDRVLMPTLVTHSVCPVSVLRHAPAERAHTLTVKSAEPLTNVSNSSL